jgi:hypothetical protein
VDCRLGVCPCHITEINLLIGCGARFGASPFVSPRRHAADWPSISWPKSRGAKCRRIRKWIPWSSINCGTPTRPRSRNGSFAIKREEALASVDHSVAEVDQWEQAGLDEDEVRNKVKATKKLYEDALREKFYQF